MTFLGDMYMVKVLERIQHLRGLHNHFRLKISVRRGIADISTLGRGEFSVSFYITISSYRLE